MTKMYFDGRLIIDWSEALGHPCELVIGAWDTGLMVTSRDSIEQHALQLGDIGDWLFNINDIATAEWLDSIPSEILAAVNKLPSRRAELLQCAAEDAACKDLLLINPLLLWCLLDRGILNARDIDDYLLMEKQRYLCHRIGLSGTRQQVKLLRRAAQSQLDQKSIRDFVELLDHTDVCQFFAHGGEISSEVIALIKSNIWLVSCTAAALIPSLVGVANRRIFDDVLRMMEDISALKRCKTVASLNRLHDALVEELNERDHKTLKRDGAGNLVPFPSPPLIGSDSIRPIMGQIELLKEGREMRHCIASYITSVLAGEFYVYQMLDPQRLTIGVVVTAWGQCYLKEVRGRGNSLPSDYAMNMVTSWFAANEPETSDGLPKIPMRRAINQND